MNRSKKNMHRLISYRGEAKLPPLVENRGQPRNESHSIPRITQRPPIEKLLDGWLSHREPGTALLSHRHKEQPFIKF